MEGYFEKEFVLTPDYCDARAGLSPYGAFTIFQAIATEHAERIGVGGAAMAKRGEFWLTVHSRVDFVGRAHLMQTLRAKTWPEPCDETSIRCFRSYSLNCGDTPVALGRTQWAILGPEQKVVPFGQSGFPRDFPFTGEAGITAAPVRFRDDFAPEDFVRTYTVRPTDIDFGQHMNNVAYIRVLLDCFSAAELASGRIAPPSRRTMPRPVWKEKRSRSIGSRRAKPSALPSKRNPASLPSSLPSVFKPALGRVSRPQA